MPPDAEPCRWHPENGPVRSIPVIYETLAGKREGVLALCFLCELENYQRGRTKRSPDAT